MRTLLPHHAQELYEGSGIDPAIIARRGCFSATAGDVRALGFAPSQCRPGLIFPQWTLAGVQVNHLLKPDEPRTDEHGKPLKYEAPAGCVPHFDIHPDALAAVRDVSQTLYFSEGNKKGDAAWTRGLPCVSLTGVYQFLYGRLVVPDLDEIPLEGRRVRVVFDSDVTRKPSVADALLRFCAALHRRGAIVEVIYLPEGEAGAKVGLDDFFVAGNTVADLEALAKPWNGKGPGVWMRDASERAPGELRETVSLLVQAIANPEISRAQLMVMAAVAGQVMHKQARGQVEPDGRIALSAAEISDDWRPAPEKGERVAPLNPTGTRPRMARERVGALMSEAVEKGLLRAKPRPTLRQHSNGTMYKTTDWLIDPVASFTQLIDPWARYRPSEPTTRKPRTIAKPCPECGKVHPILRTDACTGCGAIIAQTLIAPEPPTDDAGAASDKSSEARDEACKPSSSPAPSPNVRSVIGGAQPQASDDVSDPFADLGDDPLWADDEPAVAFDPPVWHDLTGAQERLNTASRVDDPAEAKRARQDLEDELATIARQRGRTPVPKPTRSELPGMPAEAQRDPWTDEVWL